MTTYSQLYHSGGTDLQRLLQNIKPNTPRPPQCGRTYSTLLLMAGQVFYGRSNTMYLYIGETNHHCVTIQYEFMDLLKIKGQDVSSVLKGMCIVPTTNQRFTFATADNWEVLTRGYTIETAFIDVFFKPSLANVMTGLARQASQIHMG